ncbi:6-phosphogluconolactonase [Laribacter hongkongensis]|uniref:6-phosphogluconolactonase n=1 Tax=Laribacter hongkongensis TaxID=168471 RepID=UPI001EFDAA18|nr:6-phosphogluconolactonase [Laribacter hongkongensis]MCG8991359.1 6-phosphogluconolactonase [Laribacter hongkongensis]MCG9000523.1 6-phosphogluconolactonase [Laribacter hongkongensis]MCG9006988.1 6-phosphogluconolactonase [Laribacter hongkongensis]MCG9015342.1 6-phosphogluconolactonase [Laribacter hongkongensis]MCG9096990.1 6-phosphogluconolactonase [Laribacter hongkongensis]
MRRFHVFDTATDAVLAAARHLLHLTEYALRARQTARLALAGGQTPVPLYDWLAHAPEGRAVLGRTEVIVCPTDERWVPAGHPRSNADLLYRHLVTPLASHAPPALHTWPVTASSPLAAATDMASWLEHWRLPHDALPRLDVALLGLGDDGHTASLFSPGDGKSGLTAVTRAPDGEIRLSFSIPVLAAAHARMFLVLGPSKAAALKAVWCDEQHPAALLADADWFVDVAAARRLEG